VTDLDKLNQAIATAEAELASIQSQRTAILNKLQALRREKTLLGRTGKQSALSFPLPLLNNRSREAEKIALFRMLFRGRTDVYPLRFTSAKTGKAGYSPSCAHEWVAGLCDKPRTRCTDCKNQAFRPVADQVIRCHLLGYDPSKTKRGDFVAGVYPLLLDESCWFLAVDFDKRTW